MLQTSNGPMTKGSKPTSPHQTTRPSASSPDALRRMRRAKRRDTECELAIRSAVHRMGLRFRVDWKLPDTQRRADLAFVSAKIVVFVDGCFWHVTRATNPRRVQPLLPFLASFVRARGVSRRIVSREAPGPGTVRRSRRRSGAPSASVTLSASIALDAKRMPA